MLLSIPTSKLTYADVLGFIAQNHREGVGLDYKEDFPKGLEKTICAMANSYGGTILIGAADKDGYPDPKSKGIKFEIGHAERVARIAVDNVSPLVLPDVATCQQDGACFVVIRVPKGKETPYTVRRNQVYIRTGNVNTPDDLATLDRIEWLQNSRAKSEDLRSEIIRAMASRAKNRESIQGLAIPFGIVSISFGPVHPFEPLFSEREMLDIRQKVQVEAYSMGFPSTAATMRTVQGGVSYFEHHKSSRDFNYVELNRFGYFYLYEDMGTQKFEKTPSGAVEVTERRFDSFKPIRAADLIINSAKRMYAMKGYQGELRLTIRAEKLLKIPVHPFPGPDRWLSSSGPQTSVDDCLVWQQDWIPAELESFESRAAKLVEIGNELTFSLGLPNEEGFIRRMLDKYSLKDAG